MTLTQINKAGLDELALDHVFTIGASGSDHYTFQGEGLNGTVNDPTLYLTRGKTYRFEKGSAHPLRIQSTSGASGTAYNTGVTNNGGTGTVIVEVQHDAPDVLYYQCTSHANMNGILYITGALADGGVTTAKIADSAVTTAKIAADAVTGAKIADDAINSEHYTDGSIDTAHIANSQVTADKLADNAVTTNKIQNSAVSTAKINDGAVTDAKIADTAVTLAKLEHGTSSNDGKFLRANNGADPTFETVSGTTINNNADNRVITGSGTANTLEAESSLVYDGTKFGIGSHSGIPNTKFDIGLGVFEATGDDEAADWGANNVFQLTATGGNAANNQVLLVGCHSGGVGQIGSGIGFGRDSTTNWGTYLSFKYHTTSTSNIDELKEGMRLNSGGRLLVHTTTDYNGFLTSYAESGQPYPIAAVGGNTSQGLIGLYYSTSLIGSITVTGGGSTVAYNTSSDYRLKENIVDLSNGITRLKTLIPRRFNWKNDKSTTIDGFLAHEVTAVPEAVTGAKDEVATEDNEQTGVKKGDPIYQQIDPSKLVPLLTAALQEAVSKIEVLETKVAALEAA